MSTLLVYFSQTGGANALLPMLRTLPPALRIRYAARDLVADYVSSKGVELEPCFSDVMGTAGGIGQRIREIGPAVLLTDTISLERDPMSLVPDLWKAASEQEIPILAFMDCWWGYKQRFPSSKNGWEILPDYICTVDDEAALGLFRSGIPVERIIVLGSPRLARLKCSAVYRSGTGIKKMRNELGAMPGETVLVHVSQPFEQACGPVSEWGYSETTVLTDICNTLKQLTIMEKKSMRLVVLPHPEEDIIRLERILEDLDSNVHSLVWNGGRHTDVVQAADLITGIVSFLLVEAVAMGKPVVSVQTGRLREEMLPTGRLGATVTVLDPKELKTHLLRAMLEKNYRLTLLRRQRRFTILEDACHRWKDALALLINDAGNVDEELHKRYSPSWELTERHL